MRTAIGRGFVALTASGAAIIHGAAAVTSADWMVGAVLSVAGAAELAIAVGVASAARWLPSPRTVALLLVTPVLLWAALLMVAVTADTPAVAGAVETVPLAGASVLGLTGAAFAGADARRTRAVPRERPARVGVAVVAAVVLTGLVVVPSVAIALPAATAAAEPELEVERSIVFEDHSGHVGDED